MPAIHVERAAVARLVAATFPEYTGNKFQLVTCEQVTITGLNWEGGSRNRYRACSLDGQPLGSMDRFNQLAPWSNPADGQSTSLPRGVCVVKHSIACGKDYGITVYANPQDMAPLLPAPVTLSDLDKAILLMTACHKASYGGLNRYQRARQDAFSFSGRGCYGLTRETFPSESVWEQAKASLCARGFLNRAGAITNAGRNAIAGESRY